MSEKRVYRGAKWRGSLRNEGETAFVNGLKKTDNPYDYNSTEYVLWDQGFYNRGEGLQQLMKIDTILDEAGY